MPRSPLLLARALSLGCLASLGCATVHVKTDPPDARVEVDGEDVSARREFKEGWGWKDHAVTVRRQGYRAKTVMVPRDRIDRRWGATALATSVGCTFVSAGCGCCAGSVLGNRQVVPDFLGASLASLAGGGACVLLLPVNVLTAAIVGAVAPDICMVPAMGLCTLACSWPLAGLAAPLLVPRAADVVEVSLEPAGGGADADGGDDDDLPPQRAPASRRGGGA